jgi:hypothetical protein
MSGWQPYVPIAPASPKKAGVSLFEEQEDNHQMGQR